MNKEKGVRMSHGIGVNGNLCPVRTKSEARERGRAGGIASGKARREKAARKIRIQEIIELIVDKNMLPEYVKNADGTADMLTVIDLRLVELCRQGNIRAIDTLNRLLKRDPFRQQEFDLKKEQFEFEKEKWQYERDGKAAGYSEIIDYFKGIVEADGDGT